MRAFVPRSAITVLVMSTVLAACDSKDRAATSSKESSTSDSASEIARDETPSSTDAPAKTSRKKGPPQPIDAATVGTIRGTVRFTGTPPERKEMAIGQTAGCEHHPVPPLTEDVIVADGKVANVFVYVKQGLDGWIVPPPPTEPVVLDQQGCMYRPRVIGVRVGQTLRVRNSDGATHNVHARSERNDAFNKTQAPGGADVDWIATKPELWVPFGCDIHPWMKAWVAVRDHPFFAVSGADGAFEIRGLPPGEYVLEAVHEKLGKKTVQAMVSTNAEASVTFTFAAN